MNLGFKTHFQSGLPTYFVEKVLASFGYNTGASPKRHTVRKGSRWKSGDIIHFCTGLRTKRYNCFHTGKCVSTQEISIEANMSNEAFEVAVLIDGRPLDAEELKVFAANDGFDSAEGFIAWFFPLLIGQGQFEGQVVHWTDLRY